MPTLYPIIRRKRRPLTLPETVVPPVVVDQVEPVPPPVPTEESKPVEVSTEKKNRRRA